MYPLASQAAVTSKSWVCLKDAGVLHLGGCKSCQPGWLPGAWHPFPPLRSVLSHDLIGDLPVQLSESWGWLQVWW